MCSEDNHYNKSGMFIFLLSMVGSIAFFVYIAFIHPGVTGIDKIAEVSEAGTGAKEAKIEAIDPDSVEKPWISEPGLVAAGAEVYAATCASCHGAKGLGDGVAAIPGVTRNLVKGEWKAGNGSSEHLFKVLQDGLPGTMMVSFKAVVPKNKRWALVHFMRSITENKAEDDQAALEAFAKTAD